MRSGDAERGLRPQGAPAPQRGHSPASIVRRANLAYSAPVELNVDGTVDMRSGGSVLKAPRRRRGGTPPPEHRPRAGSAELARASSANRRNKLHMGTEKALRYLGEPFLYVLELAKLSLDGIAGMRSGGFVLKAPRRRRGGTPPRASSTCRPCKRTVP